MADLRKAKSQIKLSRAERRLQAVQIMYDASIAYFNWKKNYEQQIYSFSCSPLLRYGSVRPAAEGAAAP
jgi:hypothetical protein